jgi:threonine dehydrogenase-like Zn-dependent dehydrogenase
MKQVFASQGQIDVLDVPEPTLRAAGEVLVATAFSVISSGTELDHLDSTLGATETHPELRPSGRPKLRSASISWEMPADRSFPPNVALQGYSSAGTVLAVAPEITDLKVGDLVACGGLQSAFHAEIVAVPRNLVALVPAGVSLDDAAFTTVGTIAMNPIRRSGCQFGETMVIYGLGLMGLMAVQIARTAGMHVVGIDIDNRRVEAALELGAHVALNPNETDPVDAVLDFTDGFGADGVILYVSTKSNEPLNIAFDLCRQRGCVVGVGQFGMDIVRSKLFAHDVTLLPSVGYGPGRYDQVYEEGNVDYPIGYVRWSENRNMKAFLRLLAERQIEVSSLASERFPIQEAAQAYQRLQSPDRPVTVLLTYGQD